MVVRALAVALLLTAGLLGPPASAAPPPAATAPSQASTAAATAMQLAKRKPRATLSASRVTLDSGRVRVSVTSNAKKVRLTYRTAKDRKRVVTIKVRRGAGARTLPKGSTSIRAKALATRTLRASLTRPVLPVTAPDTTAPGPVSGLRVTATTPASVSLGWTNPTEADLASIIVRRAVGTTAPASPTAGAAVPLAHPRAATVTDTGLASDTAFSYAVFARDTAGNTSGPVTVAGRTRELPTATIELGPPAAVDATVDPGSRASVLSSLSGLAAQERVDPGWTGSVGSCAAGDTSAAFKAAVRDRVNWHRNMVGLPDVGIDPTASARAQQAALMMSAERALSHSPGSGWACYTAAGASAAGQSNLYLGRFGPRAISGYVDDPGANNAPVGHRRWILYPRLSSVGTGDVPSGEQPGSNALHVFDHGAASPAGLRFVSWPNAGFTPMSMLPTSQRWSFSLPGSWSNGADFTKASVTVEGPDRALPVVVASADALGYGDNTLVFEVSSLGLTTSSPDTTFTVTITDVLYQGSTRAYRYRVTVVPAA